VDVTDATTWETVIVFVNVAVDVRVVVEDVSAIARRGKRRREEMVGKYIVIVVNFPRERIFECEMKMRRRDRIGRWDLDDIAIERCLSESERFDNECSCVLFQRLARWLGS